MPPYPPELYLLFSFSKRTCRVGRFPPRFVSRSQLPPTRAAPFPSSFPFRFPCGPSRATPPFQSGLRFVGTEVVSGPLSLSHLHSRPCPTPFFSPQTPSLARTRTVFLIPLSSPLTRDRHARVSLFFPRLPPAPYGRTNGTTTEKNAGTLRPP